MASNDAVDEAVSFGSQAEDSPASVAVTYSSDFAVLGAELLSAGKDLWLSLFSAMSSKEAFEVYLAPCFSFESVGGKALAGESVSQMFSCSGPRFRDWERPTSRARRRLPLLLWQCGPRGV